MQSVELDLRREEKVLRNRDLAFFEFYLGIIKRNFIWFLIFPLLLSVVFAITIVSLVPENRLYTVILALSNQDDISKQVETSNNPNSIIPNLELPELRLSINTEDVSEFITKSFPVKKKSFDDLELYVQEVNTTRRSNMVYLTLAGGANENAQAFVTKILNAVNKNLSPLTVESLKELNLRLSFLESIIADLENEFKRIDNALSSYGFSAILVQERNVLIPRISYLKGLKINYANSITNLKKGIVQQKSLVQKSQDVYIPHLYLGIVFGFLLGVVIALGLTLVKEVPGFLSLSKKFLLERVAEITGTGVQDDHNEESLENKKSEEEGLELRANDEHKDDEYFDKLVEKVVVLLKKIDSSQLDVILQNWLSDGAKGKYKIALLTIAWHSQPASEKLLLPKNSSLADVFLSLKDLTTETKVEYLMEVYNELVGVLSLGEGAFQKLFSTFTVLNDSQLLDLLNKFSNEEKAYIVLGLEDERRNSLLRSMDSKDCATTNKALLSAPDKLSIEALEKIEEKAKSFIKDANSDTAASSKESRSVLSAKQQILESLDFVESFNLINEVIHEDPKQLDWFKSNYFSFALIPYFRDDVLKRISSEMSPDLLLNVFSLFGKETLDKVISMQAGARNKILKDNSTRFDPQKANLDMVGTWFTEFKAKNVRNFNVNAEAFYAVAQTDSAKKAA